MELKLDLHVHGELSPDSLLTIEQTAALCRERGMDGFALCNHDVSHLSPTEIDGIIVIPGIEISTAEGHLLGLFLEQPVAPTKDFSEAVRRIHTAGGIAVLAHPYQKRRQANSEIDARLDRIGGELDGIEVFNSRAEQSKDGANAAALAAAKRMGLPGFAGSDAHLPGEIGNVYVTVTVPEKTLPAIKASLLAGGGAYTGRLSAPLNTARSQRIKLKKNAASTYKYCKNLAYCVKCITRRIIMKREPVSGTLPTGKNI